jgi:hypothetical protein
MCSKAVKSENSTKQPKAYYEERAHVVEPMLPIATTSIEEVVAQETSNTEPKIGSSGSMKVNVLIS